MYIHILILDLKTFKTFLGLKCSSGQPEEALILAMSCLLSCLSFTKISTTYKLNQSTVPIPKIISAKNARAWVSMDFI